MNSEMVTLTVLVIRRPAAAVPLTCFLLQDIKLAEMDEQSVEVCVSSINQYRQLVNLLSNNQLFQ